MHVLARGLDAAHHLRDERDLRVVPDRGEVVRQHTGRRGRRALLRRVADERAHDAQPVPGRALDLVGVLVQEPLHGGAHRAVAEEGDGDVDGRGAHARIIARS